jgi:hypothetical protein
MKALDQHEFLIGVVDQKSQRFPAEGTKRPKIRRHRLSCDLGAVLRFVPAFAGAMQHLRRLVLLC